MTWRPGFLPVSHAVSVTLSDGFDVVSTEWIGVSELLLVPTVTIGSIG